MLIDLSKALDILELKLLPRLIVHHLDLNHLQMKQVYRQTNSLNLRMNHLLNGNISYFDGTRLESFYTQMVQTLNLQNLSSANHFSNEYQLRMI